MGKRWNGDLLLSLLLYTVVEVPKLQTHTANRLGSGSTHELQAGCQTSPLTANFANRCKVQENPCSHPYV